MMRSRAHIASLHLQDLAYVNPPWEIFTTPRSEWKLVKSTDLGRAYKEPQMSGTTMEELLAEYSDPLTEGEYRSRREQLLLAFQDQHNLYTWSAIEKAIRTNAIEESELVDEWIELRAFEPSMSDLG